MSIRRILIVDRPEEFRRYLDDFRGHSGSVVITAVSREEALDRFGEGDIALVILDFTFDHAARTAIYFDLLAMPVHHGTPVIFLVDRNTEPTVRKLLQRPIDRMVGKPISGRRLAEASREALNLPSRRAVELLVRLYRMDGGDPFPIRAKTLNMSSGGLFVQTQVHLDIGQRLKVAVRVPDNDAVIELETILRRKETMGQDIGYGLQVVRLLSGDPAAMQMAYGVDFSPRAGQEGAPR